ncbi:MAG: hypothetical protein JJ949_18275 [Roseicyclus sp.]|nr:hypothetical protein [Roseicyclus sp.]MBO6921851.1 hypothetical protein [Roseicyclus sp.]
MSGFNIGDAAEGAASKTIERALNSIYEPVATTVGVSRARFFEDFGKYCHYMFKKSAFVRTIISSGSAEPLEKIYVPSRFQKTIKNIQTPT